MCVGPLTMIMLLSVSALVFVPPLCDLERHHAAEWRAPASCFFLSVHALEGEIRVRVLRDVVSVIAYAMATSPTADCHFIQRTPTVSHRRRNLLGPKTLLAPQSPFGIKRVSSHLNNQNHINESESRPTQPTMPAMQIVQPQRFLDGIVFGVFLMFLSGITLYMVGEFHQFICVRESEKFGLFAKFLSRFLPFPKNTFSFNLTHVLLFSVLVALLSLSHHPAQDCIEENALMAKKRVEKKREKDGKGKDE